ncbi:UNVERIFIED_CONTAM: Lysophospholipid acyltransferase LPEAT2 [Sesamum latifolium]|uniref:Lysophospholipid acyltransferase LPEAT2 n=1 Tax=Sesamum latifolium TaxID=2727402 RepID=A0AAW2YG92_9LAMI
MQKITLYLLPPLLRPPPPPDVVLTVHDQYDPPESTSVSDSNSQALFQQRDEDRHNPFAFIGASDGFEIPGSSTIDPFRNHTPSIEGLYEWVKILICLPVAAVRLVLFGLCLAVGYLATRLALYGWKDKQNPMPRWRCRLMWITRYCARAILFSFGNETTGHDSSFIPSLDGVEWLGTARNFSQWLKVIYVDRFSRSSRKHAVNEIKRKASCNQFPRVLLFPEGTTSNGRVIISFQLGAFIPGYPVQPVVVRYPHCLLSASLTTIFSRGNIALAKLMFRMFTQFHNFMEIEYLPLVSPHENRKENAHHFAQRTGHVIASALNVAQTSHSYGDFMLLARAAESKQENPSLYMVEMARVQSNLHLRALEAIEFLEIFLSMNPDRSGHVEFHDFLRALKLKPCGLSEKMFGFIDVQKIGKITFKQFLLGSAHILKQPLFHHACELAFSECDMNGKNYILKQELQDAVSLTIPNLNYDEIHGLFSLFDMDNDGKISKDDFVSCLRRCPLLIALFAPKLLHRSSSIATHSLVEEVF